MTVLFLFAFTHFLTIKPVPTFVENTLILKVAVLYNIKEAFYTLQGEGYWTGRPAVFLRFAGCNLWSGREKDRATAQCKFCDTDFVGTNGEGGGKFQTAEALAAHVTALWGGRPGQAFIVCTGGEPLLQLDTPLVDALHKSGFEIAVETNGTIKAPEGIDWICVSPKLGTDWLQQSGHELKFVYPQTGAGWDLERMAQLDFQHFFIQPMEAIFAPKESENNLRLALQFCRENPKWRLSLQTHKILGIP